MTAAAAAAISAEIIIVAIISNHLVLPSRVRAARLYFERRAFLIRPRNKINKRRQYDERGSRSHAERAVREQIP